jgi:hypothetical protein
VFVTSAASGHGGHASGSIKRRLHFGPNRAVKSMRLHLANFHDFNGTPVKFKHGGGGPQRLSLQHGDWRVELDQTPDWEQIVQRLRIHGGYGVGHVGAVTRTSGEAFTVSGADDLLNCLHFFLSFARGFWCGSFVVEGLGRRGHPIWTRWTSHLLATNWRGVSSWFPVVDARAAGTIFMGFRDLCTTDPMWTDSMRGQRSSMRPARCRGYLAWLRHK